MEYNTAVKKLTTLQRTLNILSDLDEHTNTEFYQSYLPRYGARMHELRKAGMRITSTRIDSGHFTFKWIATPEQIDLAHSIMPDGWTPRVWGQR